MNTVLLFCTIAHVEFDPHSGHVVASLDKTLYDDYLALVASLKQRFSGEEVEEIHRNIGSQETPKLVRILSSTK